MQRNTIISTVMLLLLGLAVSACGDDSTWDGAWSGLDTTSAYEDTSSNWGAMDTSSASDMGEPAPGSDTAEEVYVPPPPEIEISFNYDTPKSSESFVFVALTDSDLVVKVDAKTLAVTAIEVGDGPTVLGTVPGQDTALVINRNTYDVSIIRATKDEDFVTTVDVLKHSNAMIVSPYGPHAVVFYHKEAAEEGDPVGSLQSVSVIHLDTAGDLSVTMPCGFHPTNAVFTDDGERLLMITDDGISVLDLTDPTSPEFTPPIPVNDDPLSYALEQEVVIEPSGTFAVARIFGEQRLTLVNIPDREVVSYSLKPAAPVEPPVETEEVVDEPEIMDEEVVDQGTRGPDTVDEVTSGTDATDELVDGTEISDEIVDPAEVVDEVAMAEVTEEVVDEIDTTDELDGTIVDITPPDTIEPGEVAEDTSETVDDAVEEVTSEVVDPPTPSINYEATDVDITPDGSMAIVTMRDAGKILLMPLPMAFYDQSVIKEIDTGDYTLGLCQVAPTGDRAVFYTTSSEMEYLASMKLDLPDPYLVFYVDMKKGVERVEISPDGTKAVVMHTKEAGTPNIADFEQFLDTSYGYSLFDMPSGAMFLRLIDHEPGDWTFTSDSAKFFMVAPDPTGKDHIVEEANLTTFLFEQYHVDYPPLFVRSVPATTKVAVVEDHTAGRITFIDAETGETNAVTGFELNELIQ